MTNDEALLLKTLKNLLVVVKAGETIYMQYGVCHELMVHSSSTRIARLFCRAARDWPKYSGNLTYPIAGEDEYERVWDGINLFEGGSGILRQELMQFVIDKLEAKQNETNTTNNPTNIIHPPTSG